jgi:membrane-bound lytic murein transglycosylase B
MSARIRRSAFGTALVLAAACSSPRGEAASAASEASATTAVDRAVAVAQAIEANPTAADSILAAHGLTRAGFDSLLYDIAADSALARAYTEAIR